MWVAKRAKPNGAATAASLTLTDDELTLIPAQWGARNPGVAEGNARTAFGRKQSESIVFFVVRTAFGGTRGSSPKMLSLAAATYSEIRSLTDVVS